MRTTQSTTRTWTRHVGVNHWEQGRRRDAGRQAGISRGNRALFLVCLGSRDQSAAKAKAKGSTEPAVRAAEFVCKSFFFMKGIKFY